MRLGLNELLGRKPMLLLATVVHEKTKPQFPG